ncbi:MAG TPA: 3-dehydroquinate synthase [Candidatus Acidoferrales bacterium]|nr:3-dehydroquinate synthase [Candidatus Acidoferrales bacterium]
MKIQQIQVRAAEGAYDVLFGRGLLREAGTHLARVGGSSGTVVLTSARVWRHCSGAVKKSFHRLSGGRVILFDDRESAKTLRSVEGICRRLVRAGADRETLLVAVGGGVVGDVSGYVAASFLRGVGLVHVPTTLVAQVDSAIGGKTGVNLSEGKNLVGAFYPPRLVLADPDALETLPQREFTSGLYEVIKYGIIGDPELFHYLERNLPALCGRDAAALDCVIPRCIQIKADVVSRDERESGIRECLNFGHTFAHALETATRYRVFRHGEAVAWGMTAAALLGVALGRTSPVDAALMVRLISLVGPLPALPKVAPKRLLKLMHSDKKARQGRLRFVVCTKVGRVETISDLSEEMVSRVLKELPNFVRGGR